MKNNFYLLLLLIYFPFSNIYADELFEYLQIGLDSIQIENNIKGISAAVLLPDGTQWLGVTGVSHNEVKINSEMLFGIGSNSKTIVSVLLLILQEQGILDLDDKIGNWLPETENVNPDITIRQLLNHTSGLFNYPEHPEYSQKILENPLRIWQSEELFDFILAPNFTAGKSWAYSNTNTLLAGIIALKATNEEKIATLFRKYIFDAIGLTNTYLTFEEELVGEVAHRWIGDTDFYYYPLNSAFSAAWVAGAVFSKPYEMTQFYNSIFSGKILNQNSMEQLLDFVPPQNYGLFISRKIIAGVEIYGHTGAIRGYVSIMFYIPDLNISVAILTNQSQTDVIKIAEVIIQKLKQHYTSVYDKSASNNFNIYPNPSSDFLKIEIMNEFANVYPIVFDMFGKEVKNVFFNNNASYIILDVESLPSGLYFLKIENNIKPFMKLK
jgi:CubicO group peptidase (beta-lactamase class C family)